MPAGNGANPQSQIQWFDDEQEIPRNQNSPQEPRAAVAFGAILSPRAEVMATGNALPASAPARHTVVLAEQQRLGFPPVPIAEVREVYVACGE
jgi:hypothetical protein